MIRLFNLNKQNACLFKHSGHLVVPIMKSLHGPFTIGTWERADGLSIATGLSRDSEYY